MAISINEQIPNLSPLTQTFFILQKMFWRNHDFLFPIKKRVLEVVDLWIYKGKD
jgi:hypothetical protein